MKAEKSACERCGKPWYLEGLEVHHLHYESLWSESPDDVDVLCKRCHVRAHEAYETSFTMSFTRLECCRADGPCPFDPKVQREIAGDEQAARRLARSYPHVATAIARHRSLREAIQRMRATGNSTSGDSCESP
jgi:hypothetical protein